MHTTFRVRPDSLAEVANMFRMFGIRIVGSFRASDEIGLYIEGDPVPDNMSVNCLVERFVTDKSATIKLTFEPVKES